MNKFFALVCCLFASVACAEEETLVIESGAVEYCGSTLSLSEGVSLEHPLGKLTAQEMVLKPPEGEKKTQLGTLDMSRNVRLHLKEGGQLSCAEAHLDAVTQRGLFAGSPADPFVVYMENCREKGAETRLPLVVKSRHMAVWIDKELTGETSHHYFRQIDASEDVTVDYNHDFIAQADEGCYQRVGTGLASTIHLRAKEAGRCRVTNRNGDLIHARDIAIDTEKRCITFGEPRGAFLAIRGEQKPERLDFSADTLVWDDQDLAFTLCGHVSIMQKGIGTLTTADTLKVKQKVYQKKKQLQIIESSGMTCLKHADHTLTCYGKVTVDHVNLVITLESPSDGPQVFFEDERGEIHADRVKMNYAVVEKGITAQKIILDGNVKIQNTRAAALQYALADRAEYLPASQEMELFSNPGQRVLFYDKANDLEVSAPGIKIKRDLITQKDSIKGVGDVRFSLIEHEFEQLREKFSLKPKKGDEEL